MKDKNGHDLRVGDTVRFFGRYTRPSYGSEEWYEGKVTHIELNVENKWDGVREPVAHISRPKDDMDDIVLWKRYSSDVERKEVV